MEHVLATRCAKTFIAKAVKSGQLTAENKRLLPAPTISQAAPVLFLPFADCYRYAHDYHPF
jgi:hypothetical protein